MIRGPAGEHLQRLATEFADVRALLVISPHWISKGLQLSAAVELETIHDFGGFPGQLYQLSYPAKGDPQLADEIAKRLEQHGFLAGLNGQRGLDHGAWVPLMYLMPEAEIPVIQLSLDMDLDSRRLVELGRVLAGLRQDGIGIIATGGITHNLHDMGPELSPSVAYAERFQLWVRERVEQRDIGSLCQPHIESADFRQAHPSAEHYLPLLIAMGAITDSDHLKLLQSPILHRAISMESYFWS